MAITIGGVSVIRSYLFDRAYPQSDDEGLVQSLSQAEEDALQPSIFERYLGKNPYTQIYDDKGKLLYATEAAKEQKLTPEFVEQLSAKYHEPYVHGIPYINSSGQSKLTGLERTSI